MYSIKRIFNPEIYQGKYKHRNYFEGWYYKIIDKSSQNIFAIIPGVSITQEDKYAFIQFINAKTGLTKYIKYKIENFYYSERELDISINNNHFNKFGLTVDFDSEDLSVSGNVNFIDIVPFPKSFLNPGIMGSFSFVPFMECHHGIVNMHCELEGNINFNGELIDFTGGYGYLEKDWGSSFPQAWIWFQSNHFDQDNVSVMFSIAAIPWFHRHFDGLIAFLRIGDKFFRFATYTGAKISKLNFDNDQLNISIEDSKYILHLEVTSSSGGILKAPKKGSMELEITETITALAKVILAGKDGTKLFEGLGKNTGLELAGGFKKFIM
ncbi:MAG: tocopherol cyclase family protein [Ruminiclostridium sp.]